MAKRFQDDDELWDDDPYDDANGYEDESAEANEFDDHDNTDGLGEEDEASTADCPHCGEEIYEDAEWCPYCENYLTREEAPTRHPWWWVAGVLLCLAIVVSWFFIG